jgi:hypothetical protein
MPSSILELKNWVYIVVRSHFSLLGVQNWDFFSGKEKCNCKIWFVFPAMPHSNAFLNLHLPFLVKFGFVLLGENVLEGVKPLHVHTKSYQYLFRWWTVNTILTNALTFLCKQTLDKTVLWKFVEHAWKCWPESSNMCMAWPLVGNNQDINLLVPPRWRFSHLV